MTADEIAGHRRQRYNATVVGLRKVHSDLMVFRVRPDFPRPKYHPGQYCALGLGYWEPRVAGCQDENLLPDDLPKLVRRSYSISNSIYADPGTLRDMAADDWLEFYVVLVRENADGRVPALTPRLFALGEGDRLNVGEKIVGHFTVEPVRPGDTVVLLSTGTGEAPHNSMVWDLLRRGHAGKVLNACCVRFKKDLGYLAEHEALMRQFPNYAYVPLVTREPGALAGKVYIQDLITSGELEKRLGEPLDPARAHVFLCGNPKMIGIPEKDKATGLRRFAHPGGVIEILEARGFRASDPTGKVKGNVHFEKYW